MSHAPSAPAFTPTGMGLDIFQGKYTRTHDESWVQYGHRAGSAVAAAEDNGKAATYGARYTQQIIDGLLAPGGRINYGAGRKVQQLLNCVSGDTMVQTLDGLISARELEGRKVAVLSQGGVFRQAHWKSYGEQELFRVVFANGDEIEATAGHEWVVSKVKGGDERVTTANLAGRSVPMEHMKTFIYDEQSYAEGIRHGLIYGDGTINHTGKASMVQFGDSRHLVEDHFDGGTVQRNARFPEGVTYIGAQPAEWKDLPSTEEGMSYIRGFIAGLMAADGCVDSRGHAMIHAADLDALIQIRHLAAGVGLPTTGIKMTREFNPWSGERSPVYKLSFAKAGVYDERMILKQAHRDKMFASPIPTKRQTMKVEAVLHTGRVETVYCCEEPETNTWVAGPGYLTSNCFVVPTKDSIEGWGKTISDVMTISSRGGGVGVNFSPIRPRGTLVGGMGGDATGAVSLMEMTNGIGDVLMGGGGRRMALMFDLDIDHPDILEFLDCKILDTSLSQEEQKERQKRLKNANVSVVLPPHISSERFQEMVRNGEEIELSFKGLPDREGRTVNAAWLWDRIVKNAWNGGEPGVLNAHLANEMNNIAYYKPLISTNPCGEIWLEEYGCCCLGSLVLPRFIEDGVFNWDMFSESIHLAVRFLDDVLDVNHYPLPEIEENCRNVRRIGLGLMGLHSAMLDMGFKYSSDEGFEFVEQVFKFLRNTAYRASINLAIEKGPFAAFSPEFCDGKFIKKLPEDLQRDIREHGIRNCALLTEAPTGSTAMVQGVTGGIEPAYAGVYERLVKEAAPGGTTKDVTYLVVSKEFQDHPELFESALDIHPEVHMRMQVLVQRYIDNAVSKTINLPEDYPVEELAELWLKYLPNMKGSTFYRSGSRYDEPMKFVPASGLADRIFDWQADGKPVEYEDAQSMECPSGACDVILPGGLEVAPPALPATI